MKPLDISLMGCPVTDFKTGVLLGKVRYVVVNPLDECIQSLALESAANPHVSQWIGLRLYNTEGISIGTISDVIVSASSHRLLWVETEEPSVEPIGTVDEFEPEASDYMIGQIALHRLVDSHGTVIIEEGDTVTLTTIKEATKRGLLHQLATRFP